jgi:predicted AAA+ superfamily ATPase
MFSRSLTLPKSHSFFLFGARGTGKSTWIKHLFKQDAYVIDLLNAEWEERLNMHPQSLLHIVENLPEHITHIIIDEVQKIPKLLDIVHLLIETTRKIFILTGSSAKKLKHGGANLLAGRAFVYHLFPLSSFELHTSFKLQHALQYGTLPKITLLKTEQECQLFLRSYAQIYLKEEIWNEQLVRKINPFRKFLEVAAQCNGKILNISNIARDVGIDDKTVEAYFSILEDTLLGFFLEPFVHSFRKRLSKKPKFYFFDNGVTRALTRMIAVPLIPQTSGYGEAFEHFIIAECMRLREYYQPDYQFSYLQTQHGVEVDLVIERPGLSLVFMEIKSTTWVSDPYIHTLAALGEDYDSACELIILSQETIKRKVGKITLFPWQEGLRLLFIDMPFP